MTQERKDGLEAVRKWLTPILITIIGALIGINYNSWDRRFDNIDKKQEKIDAKLELITTVQVTQGQQNTEIANLKDKVKALEGEIQDLRARGLYSEAQKRIDRSIK